MQLQGIHRILLLERGNQVGGTWRDNTYPGAACDIASQLYSYSFEPNPNWSHVYAPQPEILAYLQHCVRKYEVLPHIHFNSKVVAARFDEQSAQWTVEIEGERSFKTSILVSATGQLSQPHLPKLPGLEDFKGKVFHSANWDHAFPLDGKSVAVIGTGASAIQFVPVISKLVRQLTLFQRTPAYVIPRFDRAYSRLDKKISKLFGSTLPLVRAAYYSFYEIGILAFTRMRSLAAVPAWSFFWMLKRQIPDPALRARLKPDYPLACKRVLMASDYLSSLAKPNVDLVTTPIFRMTADGIQTEDGSHHPVDAIIFGTGFSTHEFLSELKISGRNGRDLHAHWRSGTKAHFGMSVAGFPNFFMLYGPNTNLGSGFIIHMLESQIEHVMQCIDNMKQQSMSMLEVDAAVLDKNDAAMQKRLRTSVWSHCRSWYVDATGRNHANWPGFTFTYRWLAKRASNRDYQYSKNSTVSPGANVIHIAAPTDLGERMLAALTCGILRLGFRNFFNPTLGIQAQRRLSHVLSVLTPPGPGTLCTRSMINGVAVDIIEPAVVSSPKVILYLHGGAFCLGSPTSHRCITTRLAADAGCPVWVPDYRLAPEYPYPAGLDDALQCYDALLTKGYAPNDIVIGGDSAGGGLALAMGLAMLARKLPLPCAMFLISPVTDLRLTGSTMHSKSGEDPMIRQDWLEQCLAWYGCNGDAHFHAPLESDLSGFPPLLIQVGEQEILLADSMRLAEHAAACKVSCRLEVHEKRWHDFHLQADYLKSARRALQTLAEFARNAGR